MVTSVTLMFLLSKETSVVPTAEKTVNVVDTNVKTNSHSLQQTVKPPPHQTKCENLAKLICWI